MKKIHVNSLFFKLALSVLAGVAVLSAVLSYVNIYSSEQVFTDMFSKSQEKIFGQIEERFYSLYTDFAEISGAVAEDEAVQAYLAYQGDDTVTEQQLVYQMQQRVKQTKIHEYNNVTLWIAGTSGRNYMYNYADIVNVPLAEIFQYPVTIDASEHPGQVSCSYMESGFTDTMKNTPAVIVCRAVLNRRHEVCGFVYLMVKESEIRSFYDYFLTGNSNIVVFNHANEVISTNNPEYFQAGSEELNDILNIVAQAKESRSYHALRRENGESIRYLVQQFSNSDFVIAGTVNAKKAFYEEYGLYRSIEVAFVIAAKTILAVFFLVRRQTRPLSRLADSMRDLKQRDFDGYVPVEGTDEIRELSRTYNEMLADIRHYIEKVMQTEQDKRTAELRALQMQINPHYIYNTLAGIKWLILQGDGGKAAATLDAFIALLRNTISNADEFITIRQEEQNLRNYVQISQARYGNKIQVEFYIQDCCMEAKIPKMLLQPFIENAFFHAFPCGQRGNINVFIQKREKRLIIEIADDGAGMTRQQLESGKDGRKRTEHYSGIGINNIDERLKLIYGTEYTLNIESRKGCGTTVTAGIPYSVMK